MLVAFLIMNSIIYNTRSVLHQMIEHGLGKVQYLARFIGFTSILFHTRGYRKYFNGCP